MGQDNDGAVRPPTLFVACAETSCMTDEKRERERETERRLMRFRIFHFSVVRV